MSCNPESHPLSDNSESHSADSLPLEACNWYPDVGDIVEIYWKGEKQWFRGVVFRAISSQPGVFRIKFDDKTTANFKFKPDKWRLVSEG